MRSRAALSSCSFVIMTRVTSRPDSYPPFLNDPEMTFESLQGEYWHQSRHHLKDVWLVLMVQPQNDQPSVLLRWVCPNVGEVEIERHESPLFSPDQRR